MGNMMYIKTALVTTAIFAVGVLLGMWMGEQKVNELEQTLNVLKGNLEDTELQFMFLDTMKSNISCSYLNRQASQLGTESDQLGKEVERYEISQKIDETTFNALKKNYNIVLIRDWLTIEKIKQMCDAKYATVLYFYSNKNCDKCQDQGIVLSYLKGKLKQDIMIFALDSDLGVNIVDALKVSYDITSYPTLIINGEVHRGYSDLNQTTQILCDYNSNFSIC